jgi:hypothetical protein
MGLNHLLARKRSSSSFRSKQSEASSVTPSSTTASDEKPREAKSTLISAQAMRLCLLLKVALWASSTLVWREFLLDLYDFKSLRCLDVFKRRSVVHPVLSTGSGPGEKE